MTYFGNNFDSTEKAPTTNPIGTPRSTTTIIPASITSRNTSTTTTRSTHPGVFQNSALEADHDLRVIGQAYTDVLGPMALPIARYIKKLLQDGMAAEVVLDAIQQTAWARRPSPQYFRAICARRMDQGIMSMGDMIEEHDAWEARQRPWWAPDARDRDDLPW